MRRLLSELPVSERKLFRVLERPDLAAIGADPGAVLSSAPMQGVRFNASPQAPAVNRSSGGTHGFHPEEFEGIYTGFVAWGAGIRKGAVAPMMGLEDIAPFIAALLQLKFDAPDGVAPMGLLESGAESASGPR